MWHVTAFLALAALLYAFIFAQDSGIIREDSMNEYTNALIRIYSSLLILIMLAILLPSSYTNKQTQYQMRRLIFVRDVYQRIVRDPDMIKCSPVMHDTQFARLAIK